MTMNANKKSAISNAENADSARPHPGSVARKPMRTVKSAPKPGSVSRAVVRKAIAAVILARKSDRK